MNDMRAAVAQAAVPTAGREPPRIYLMYPGEIGPIAQWATALDRCAGLGFDHVLIPPPFRLGSGSDAFLCADWNRLHEVFGPDVSVEAGFGRLVDLCQTRGLRLLVDFVPDRVAAEAAIVVERPAWFRKGAGHDGADLPDPRSPPRACRSAHVRLEDEAVRTQWQAWWLERLRPLVRAGVAGFRCDGLLHTPPAFWRAFIAAMRSEAPQLRFLAWTPGLSREALAGLVSCGFDATFSSACWWDFRSPWLAEEDDALRRIAPPIAFPQNPYGSDPLSAAADPELRKRLYRRALRLAAATGHGWMMPMGFELGLRNTTLLGSPPAVAGTVEPTVSMQFDLTEDVRRCNAEMGRRQAAALGGLRWLAGGSAPLSLLFRGRPDARHGVLAAFNADPMAPAEMPWQVALGRLPGAMTQLKPLFADADAPAEEAAPIAGTSLRLDPAASRIFVTAPAALIAPLAATVRAKGAEKKAEAKAEGAAQAPRLTIESVAPCVEGGRFAAKRVVGEAVTVSADLFMDGHDRLAACVRWRAADEKEWHEVPMRALGNDRYAAQFVPDRVGRYYYSVLAWYDAFGTYRNELEKKHAAGLDISLELKEGVLLLQRIARQAGSPEQQGELEAMLGRINKAKDAERLQWLLSDQALAQAVSFHRPFPVEIPPLALEAERPAARYASWYELFPRSQSGDPARHGTFDDVIARLPYVRDLGFDVLYFTPIHPIGKTHRKGRNNSLKAAPGDPGSPYAIGSPEGGHDAIHPQLGTLQDFRRMRDAAAAHGLELALDFAIQCSPDHPWLKDHPDWFAWRPDGSIRYAENPPKKYEDIVNVDFYAPAAVPALWLALRDVVLFWVNEGVRLFRVDNPHTKPFPFWEWLIAEVRGRAPDTVFLSEAFTRPKLMNRLAKLGFSQSYTYFTWRHTKAEFTDYLTQLTQGEEREYFRPHFFVNTPDINPTFLQRSGRPGFVIRAALASLLSGLWGMYSGFELCQAAGVPGKEEYLDSEKYELCAWDWDRPGNIKEEIALLNRLRRSNPALQSHLGLRFYEASDEHILFFGKATPERDNIVLAAINLDPQHVRESAIELPLWEWGLSDDSTVHAQDLVTGQDLVWRGKWQQLRIDPHALPFAVWRIDPARGRTT
jgi:starch synthase (maltosyl-transferring)